MSLVSFPSIGQLRQVLKDISYHYKHDLKPTVTFKGTVKLHGSNGGICYKDGQIWAQSRNMVLSGNCDNAGFYKFMFGDDTCARPDVSQYLKNVSERVGNQPICVFGEWCGKGIQRGVAIAEVSRRFVVFGAVLIPQDSVDKDTETAGTNLLQWSDSWINLETIADIPLPEGFHDINTFQTYEMLLDLNDIQSSIADLNRITSEVELECPVSASFGVKGVGEGVVWTADIPTPGGVRSRRYIFKVKGEKHRDTNAADGVSIKPMTLPNIAEFVSYAVTENRLKQGFSTLFTLVDKTPSMSDIGLMIKWVLTDVAKEETDTLTSNALTMKDVTKPVTDKVRTWFMKELMTTSDPV